jgi:hypothetical protein
VAALALSAAPPASAQAGDDDDDDPLVVLTGRVEVRAGERANTVVILDGPALIGGDVDGAVVALNGDIRVTGTVEEAVVALRGRAIIEDGARVGGDVVSSRTPQVAPGASVEGDTERVRFSFRAIGIAFWVAWWVALTISLLVLGMVLLALAPAAMAASYAVARNDPGRAIGWGVLLAVGLPIAFGLLLITLVGIPLGLLGLLSLALFYALGYVVAAFTLGRMMVKEPKSRFLAFLAGLLVLRLVGFIPALGGIVTFVAAAYGLGALAIAGWRAARRERDVVPGPVPGPAPGVAPA